MAIKKKGMNEDLRQSSVELRQSNTSLNCPLTKQDGNSSDKNNDTLTSSTSVALLCQKNPDFLSTGLEILLYMGVFLGAYFLNDSLKNVTLVPSDQCNLCYDIKRRLCCQLCAL